ncbi:MAG: hypothetical protein C0603_09930 [Denitrovibrio sp.]|nr:MAG: hypothetical protein C0603_09930 [Denitrovibrio sp.]
MLPLSGCRFDIKLSKKVVGYEYDQSLSENKLTLPAGLPKGKYFVRVRFQLDEETTWSAWSPPLWFTIHPDDKDISDLKRFDHHLSMILEKGIGEGVTLIDPGSYPPNSQNQIAMKWFPTHVYEGVTPLVNLEQDYYIDPLEYYFVCIRKLIDKGARFITWDDILDEDFSKGELDILLQFDVDGGPKSMKRVYEGLAHMGVSATIMLHYKGHYWYQYKLEDMGIDWLKKAEDNGWCMGYHNNSLSQIVGDSQNHDLDDETLDAAKEQFTRDVKELRKYFNIKTFTHHGGNVYNLKVEPDESLSIVGVDKNITPDLWIDIKTMFSDGGFATRPTTLAEYIDNLQVGTHFIRNHPFKYGNYISPVDAPPRIDCERKNISISDIDKELGFSQRECEKEYAWLTQRQIIRFPRRMKYLRLEKAISNSFKKTNHSYESNVRFPVPDGNPEIFWSRMLESYMPDAGKIFDYQKYHAGEPNCILDRKEVSPLGIEDYTVHLFSVPKKRDQKSMAGRFTGVAGGLLSCSNPSDFIDFCYDIISVGSLGCFCFIGDTHLSYGAEWSRDVEKWTIERENARAGQKWSFNPVNLGELFIKWEEIKIEIVNHYCFVIGRK